jgi:pyrroline-5-carboxylate reductase
MVMENEDDIHAFTSIIGSGQAFLFQVLNVYLGELKAINKGSDEHANNIFQDFVSSLGDLFEQERDFEILINKIKSPGGTTQAGLESLESSKIDSIFKDAFRAAKERSIQISDEN